MKRLFFAFSMIAAFQCQAQTDTAKIDLQQMSHDINLLKENTHEAGVHLQKFHGLYTTGVAVTAGGLVIATIGAFSETPVNKTTGVKDESGKEAMMIAGAITSAVGLAITLISHGKIKMAGGALQSNVISIPLN